MKRFQFFVTALMLLSVCFAACGIFSAAAGEPMKPVGEVLYHQDFSVVSELLKSGIVRGTSSSEKASFACAGKALELDTFDNERAYAILPVKNDWDSYTIEFDFSFSEIVSENGYLGFILTCRGTEPTNVTALVIRADGTIDDFEEPDETVKKAIREGGAVHVKIPVEKNVLNTIELTAGTTSCTLERTTVKVIDDGQMGFVVRNASVDVTEIYIVNGTGYSAKSGPYASESYASDKVVASLEVRPSAEEEEVPLQSPDTGDIMVPYIAVLSAMVMGLLHTMRNAERKRKETV